MLIYQWLKKKTQILCLIRRSSTIIFNCYTSYILYHWIIFVIDAITVSSNLMLQLVHLEQIITTLYNVVRFNLLK